MRSLASSAEAWPSTDNVPASGKMIDIIMRIVVVLPAPFGPMNPYTAPRGTTRSRWSTALVAPNAFVTPLRRRAVLMRSQVFGRRADVTTRLTASYDERAAHDRARAADPIRRVK